MQDFLLKLLLPTWQNFVPILHSPPPPHQTRMLHRVDFPSCYLLHFRTIFGAPCPLTICFSYSSDVRHSGGI
jgi:hypothetical protein